MTVLSLTRVNFRVVRDWNENVVSHSHRIYNESKTRFVRRLAFPSINSSLWLANLGIGLWHPFVCAAGWLWRGTETTRLGSLMIFADLRVN